MKTESHSDRKDGVISDENTPENNPYHAELGVYKQFFELSRDLMCIVSTDGYFKLINPAFTDLLGYSKEELMSKPFVEFVHPDDRPMTNGEMEIIIDTDSSTKNFENRYITKSGEEVTLQWVSTPFNEEGVIFAIARDVTEQKSLYKDLVRNEKLFNASQAVAKLGNFSYNTVDYSLYWSTELYNIFGITEEEKENLYQAYIDRFDEEGLALFQSTVENSMKTGEKYEFEHKVHIPGGPIKEVSCVGVPLLNEKGEVYRIDGVVQDITTVKSNESQLHKSLMEKEFLIKELHHRVKNNLQVISSLLRLQAENIEDKAIRDHLLDSRNRIHSMASVHNLLYRSENLGAVNFGHYLKKLTEDLESSYFGSPEMIRIKYMLNNYDMEIEKAIPLGILMNELISNAFKHAYDGVDDPELVLSLDEGREGILITVSDNGVGFDPREIDRKNSLGMNLIDSLRDQLGAELIYDGDDKGTKVSVQLPIA